jgi:hypothetical protein
MGDHRNLAGDASHLALLKSSDTQQDKPRRHEDTKARRATKKTKMMEE